MGRMMCMGELTVGRVGKEVRRGSNLPEQDQPTLPPLPEERCVSEQQLISDSSAACSLWKLMLKVSLAHFDTGAGGWRGRCVGCSQQQEQAPAFQEGIESPRATALQTCVLLQSHSAAEPLSPPVSAALPLGLCLLCTPAPLCVTSPEILSTPF